MIYIIDYKMGNLRSVRKALARIGVDSIISNDLDLLKKAEKVILPGVGHFKKGMENLTQLGIKEVLDEHVLVGKKPLLGICLGMQLLCTHSEEGDCHGLNYVAAWVKKFPKSILTTGQKIPHIGWNTITMQGENEILNGIDLTSHFYFVHSYYAEADGLLPNITTTTYGIEFISSLVKDNVYGTQFHPEKSYESGLSILRNFANI